MGYETDFDPSITMSVGNVGAVAGTGASFTSTVASQAVINGKFAVALGIQTNAALPATDANTGLAFPTLAPNQTCAIVFGQNQAGALQVVQGPIVPTAVGVTTTPGAFINLPQFPDLPSTFCPLAYTIVKTAPSAASWIAGTSAWAASGVVATVFQNVAALPARPQAS
jgi:hypothetical protein